MKAFLLSFIIAILAIQVQASQSIDSVMSTDSIRKAPGLKPAPVKPSPAKPIPANPPPSHGTGPSGPTAGNEGSTINSGPLLLETCFSPNGGCDQKLIKFISNAKSSLDIAIYSITHTGISQAIIEAKNRGVNVRLVVDRTEAKINSSQVGALQGAGVPLVIGNFTGIMHDKFTIVDGAFLETGSYNYSANATVNNAENQLYLNDPGVIQRYTENFEQMFKDGTAN